MRKATSFNVNSEQIAFYNSLGQFLGFIKIKTLTTCGNYLNCCSYLESLGVDWELAETISDLFFFKTEKEMIKEIEIIKESLK